MVNMKDEARGEARKEYLISRFKDCGLELSVGQADSFIAYYDFLIKRNEVVNLTAITDFKEVVDKHFVDSLAPVFVDDVSRETLIGTLLDVGTGAGFPGIPLKIMHPQLDVTLLDSRRKKMDFIAELCGRLFSEKMNLLTMRAEDAAHMDENRELFDIVCSRAVAHLATDAEYMLPFVKVGGHMLAYKGPDTRGESVESQKAISMMGGTLEKKVEYVLPGTQIKRCLYLIRKDTPTVNKYPRRAGIPSKNPIL